MCAFECVCVFGRGVVYCMWPKQELFTSLKEMSITCVPRQQYKEEEAQSWLPKQARGSRAKDNLNEGRKDDRHDETGKCPTPKTCIFLVLLLVDFL